MSWIACKVFLWKGANNLKKLQKRKNNLWYNNLYEDVKENLIVCKLYYNENNIMHISPIEDKEERMDISQKFMKLLNKEL